MGKFRASSGLVDCTPFVRTAGGLKQCDETIFYGAAGPIDTGTPASPLTASASPDYVFGAVSRPGSAQVTTNATTASGSGGTPPYAYAWQNDSGFSMSAANAATTTFTAVVLSGEDSNGTATCTITDAKGSTAVSNAVAVTASNYGKDLS